VCKTHANSLAPPPPLSLSLSLSSLEYQVFHRAVLGKGTTTRASFSRSALPECATSMRETTRSREPTMGSRGTGLLGARRVRRWHVHSERPVNEIDITADGGRYTFTRARAAAREGSPRFACARTPMRGQQRAPTCFVRCKEKLSAYLKQPLIGLVETAIRISYLALTRAWMCSRVGKQIRIACDANSRS